jgi:very-short-patch-repair endonuclease
MDRLERARLLRKHQTDAETRLWHCLRNRQLLGLKFRRQHAIDHYIVDFVCADLKLVVEIDGGQHAENYQYDQRRTAHLESLDYKVIRFWNNEVLTETEAVLESIRLVCEEMPRAK